MPKAPRKRIKLECQECGSHFNDDYKKKHETSKHSGKSVKVKHVGAPLNPFEASKRKKLLGSIVGSASISSVSEHDSFTQVSSSSPISTSIDSIEPAPSFNSPTPELPNVKIKHVGAQINPFEASKWKNAVQFVGSASTSSVSEHDSLTQVSSSPPISTSIDSIEPAPSSKDASGSWIEFSGKVADFLTNFEQVNHVLNSVKNEAVPNLKTFFVNMIHCLSTIQKESEDLLKFAKEEENKLDCYKTYNLDVGSEILIDRDPGNRKKVLTSNEPRYLCSLGPYQPKLDTFPMNTDIPSNKQCRFNPAWYSEFSYLEYSLEKDAAFCFVCTLFSEGVGRSYASPEWISVGVRQWHKMKSRGQNKQGKLILHFTSEFHRAALSNYCNFVKEGCHIDVLLDKSKRECQIKGEQEKEYHSRVLQILVDVAKTLGRQGLPFRGHEESTENCDGNFQQIVNLISRYCPLLKKWLDESSQRSHHVTYLSPRSQNEFIDLLGTKTEEAIVNEINKAGIFSVMVDTTTDSSHQDRLAINIRYVVQTNDGPAPVEQLLKMDVVLTKKTGEEYAEKIVITLQSLGLSVKNIIFQSYDFAKNMSGKYKVDKINLREIVESWSLLKHRRIKILD